MVDIGVQAALASCAAGFADLTLQALDARSRQTARQGMRGGTGETFDWGLVASRRSRVPLILSGGLSAENYATISKASRATATRDLQDLVEKGALVRSGELRYTRYRLALAPRG